MRWVIAFVIFIGSSVGHSLDLSGFQLPEQKPHHYLVSVDSRGQGQNWAKDICHSIYSGLTEIQYSNVTCVKTYGRFIEPDVIKAKKNQKFDYQISIHRIKFPDVLISIENLKPELDSDFQNVSFKADFTDKEKLQEALFKLSLNLNHFDLKKKNIDRLLDKVYDSDKATTHIGETYSSRIDFKKLIVETGAALGFAAFWYYSEEGNENDWENEGLLNSLIQKSKGDSVRFDDNNKVLNVGHAGAGVGYYQIARASGMTQKQAFISAFTLSAVWELGVEFREVLSINDTVLTAFSGPVIGEVLHQMARSLRQRNSPLLKALSFILDGPTGINNWLDRNKGTYKGNAQFEDEFNFNLGLKEIGLEGKVWSLPTEDKVKAFLPQAFYTELQTNIEFSDGLKVDEFQLLTKLAFMGYMKRNIEKNDDNTFTGYEFIISASSDFEWRDRKADDEDFLVHARVIGTSVFLRSMHQGYEVNLHYDFYGDFALLRSYALNDYLEENSLAGFPGVVQKEQYYYGWGFTNRGGVSIGKGRFTIGLDYETNNLKAINKRDRYQEYITKSFEAKDRHSILEAWVEMNLTPRLSVRLGLEKEKRSGRLYAYRRSFTDTSFRGEIRYKF